MAPSLRSGLLLLGLLVVIAPAVQGESQSIGAVWREIRWTTQLLRRAWSHQQTAWTAGPACARLPHAQLCFLGILMRSIGRKGPSPGARAELTWHSPAPPAPPPPQAVVC